MKTLYLVISLIGVYACQSNTHKDRQEHSETTASTQDSAASTEDKKNFFVITSWATTDREKALAHIQNQQKQLMGLWNRDIVETIYYNQKGKFGDGQPLSLIGFVIKGLSETEAHHALDTTDLVKNNLANYTLRPIGEKVFGRTDKAINTAAKSGEVYAVVWAFLEKRDSVNTNVLGRQAQLNIKLQQEGILENGYIDLRSMSANPDGVQPAVYFINAKSEKEARQTIDAMPLVTSKQATYGLHYVGQFLAGTKEK